MALVARRAAASARSRARSPSSASAVVRQRMVILDKLLQTNTPILFNIERNGQPKSVSVTPIAK